MRTQDVSIRVKMIDAAAKILCVAKTGLGCDIVTSQGDAVAFILLADEEMTASTMIQAAVFREKTAA